MDAKEALLSVLACTRDVPNSKPSSKQDCSDVVNISLFFDGTGNNKDIDEPLKKWSNIARLWYSATQLKHKNNYPIYIAGVGTPFNGTATNWQEEAVASVEDNALGGLAGAGGSRRTEFGQHNVNTALRSVLINNAKDLGRTTKEYVEKSQNQSFSRLSKVLAGHRLIKVINLSIFGFSRGAALARAFSNDFLKQCKTDADGQLTYEGYPIRIHFMGLFDTVASFGVPAGNMDGLFSEKNLKIPGQVERCVHYVAAHELRYSFPVDLIAQNGKLMPNWCEEVYPGSHSDVGGGYWPLTEKNKLSKDADHQGISNNYARIPMRDMMREAVINGVRMFSYHDIAKINAPLFDDRFAIESHTEEAYNNYMKVILTNGSVLEKIDNHMRALYASYGTMTRRNILTPDVRLAKDDVTRRLIGHIGMAREAEALQNPESAKKLLREESHTPGRVLQYFGTLYAQSVRPEPWRLEAWNMHASEPLLTLIQHYVHDSKAGFLNGVEPFSYFRPRGVSENSRNILAKGMHWIDQKTGEVKESSIKIYCQAEKVVVETWTQGVLTATKTVEVGEQFVVDTVHAGEKIAVEVHQTSKDIVITTIDEGQKMVVNSVNTLQKKAAEIKQELKERQERLSKSVNETVDHSIHTLEQRAAELGRNLGEQQQRIAKNVHETVDAGMKEVEKLWRETKARLGIVE